ncbi:acireductone synthase [Frankia sp. AgB32]|uniref:acireductone synthase n=1 Tax=Frankia sp. AgB32 TaxID=631119 RepID=UPI00200BA4F6|nr:acireductone synthase [Frankia sp. AgB32]MCK9895081.1 acireductone synthase [Frankia sp. AgB32]
MTGAVVLDIEGTTSSLEYFQDTFVPYSAERIEEWLERCGAEHPDLMDELRSAAGPSAAAPGGLGATLRQWICEDRKAAALKSVQGLIWEKGLEAGELCSHVYRDVPPALASWVDQGLTVNIYSSGSVRAQQAWFKHTQLGDLSRYITRHFDIRNAGPKRSRDSYELIARFLDLPPSRIFFLSDVVAELDAAKAAGWSSFWVIRSLREPVGSSQHREVTDFGEVDLDPVPNTDGSIGNGNT